MSMTPSRPYLIRAIYDWIHENGRTPYMLVDASVKEVEVPREHVGDDGRITLNLSPDAVRNLILGNDIVEFECRFAGTSCQVLVPVEAVMAVYAKEDGQGMRFGDDMAPPEPPKPPDGPGRKSRQPRRPRKPRLTLVK